MNLSSNFENYMNDPNPPVSTNNRENGRANKPTAGAYVCTIINCIERPNQRFGGSELVFSLDIKEGECAGFYSSRHERHPDWNWATFYLKMPNDNDFIRGTKKACDFKKFITDVEASNPGYRFDRTESGLIGKTIGMVFQEREYDFVNENGEEKNGMTVSPAQAYSVQDVQAGNFVLLPPKRLNQNYGNNGNGNTQQNGFVPPDNSNYQPQHPQQTQPVQFSDENSDPVWDNDNSEFELPF